MTTSTTSEPSAATPLVELQGLVVAVRRRRRLWSAMALLGFLGGAAAAVAMPTPPTAETKVLVAHQADQPNDPGTLIKTDVALLTTTRIADTALKALGSAETPATFMQEYKGTGLTNNVLQITVTGKTQAEALARAKALADAFVADHDTRLQAAANAQADALLAQSNRLRAELAQVNTEIGKGAPKGDAAAAAALESLFAQRAALTSQIDDYAQRAQEARVGSPQLVAGTQIVDDPQIVRASLAKAAVTDAGIGGVLGLVLGLAVAAVGTVVRDRPVLRRDIAAHLGASVVAELRHLPRRPAGPWRRKRTKAARERLTVTLARLVRGSDEPVSLLELGCARSTAVIAQDLARNLGEDRLGVGSVAPGTAWTDLRFLGARTVLVVRAGHASTAWLHTVARQLADQRIPVLGVVLLDADPRDRTDGTLWDGKQNALRGQAERPARPNATPQANGTAQQNGTEQSNGTELRSWAVRVPDSEVEAR